MKKLNLHEIYLFGKQLSPLANLTPQDKTKENVFALWFARDALESLLRDDSPLLETARRAVVKMIDVITDVIPNDIQKALKIDEKVDLSYQATRITSALSELESVLGNDMPGIASYLVSQKGIYRTDDLILHAERQLSANVSAALPQQAIFDIQQAGKCLAFELATACTFHLWRAVETVIEEYYKSLAGKSFDDAGIASNWGSYITALNAQKADKKITTFLNHIRDEYRNPQTHPDEKIDIEEAQRLFSVALSSIDQMMRAIADSPRTNSSATARPVPTTPSSS